MTYDEGAAALGSQNSGGSLPDLTALQLQTIWIWL